MEDEICIDGIWYELDEGTKTVAVIKLNNEEKYQGEVVIPKVVVYDGVEYLVTHICGLAFYGCSGLKSITIPESVKQIGSSAICHCSGLTSIIVAENNTIYDSRNGCNALIETISNTLIAGCSKTIIPDSVTNIERLAFCGCSRLKSITIPESVEEIGYHTFAECRGLKNIYCHNFSKEWLEAFDESLVGDTTLHVPKHVLEDGFFDTCNKRSKKRYSVLSAFKEIVPLEKKQMK